MPTAINPYLGGTTGTTTSSTKTGSAQSATNSFQMGKKEFLQLLVAQLKAQNPFTSGEGGGGSSTAGFLGQVTQLATMEQLQAISDGMSKLVKMQSLAQASTLIGRYIETNPDASGDMIVGTVDDVSMSDGSAWLRVGDDMVALSDVALVADSSSYSTDYSSALTDPGTDTTADTGAAVLADPTADSADNASGYTLKNYYVDGM